MDNDAVSGNGEDDTKSIFKTDFSDEPDGNDIAESQDKDTQPINSQETVCSSPEREDSEDVWGTLIALVPYLTGVNLTQELLTIGRKNCTVLIPESANKACKYFNNISKQHCTIRLSAEACFFKVTFEDHSSNGSFINRKPVHKNTVVLCNNDTIALGHQDNCLFKLVLGESLKFPIGLRRRYRIKRLLGQGSFGSVHLAYSVKRKQRVAIKSVLRKKLDEPSPRDPCQLLQQESSLMMHCKHSSVVRIHEVVIPAEPSVFLIMEYMEGGDLLQRLRMSGNKLEEQIAKLYFMQLVNAVDYLHCKGIVHRDLKPENLLLASNEPETLLKISDFGLSKFYDEQTVLKTFCGTPMFVAPEVLKSIRGRGYGHQCDLWSIGVILYICLLGRVPFSEKRGDLLNQINLGMYYSSEKLWDTISREARDLISKLLTVNPIKRIKSCDVLQHPWLRDEDVKRKVIQLYVDYENRMSSWQKRLPLEDPAGSEREAKIPRIGD